MFTPGPWPATRLSARSTAPSAPSRCALRSAVCSSATTVPFRDNRRRLLGVAQLGLRLRDDLLLHLLAEVLVVVRAEVRVYHALVAHHGVRRTFGDHLALSHHDHPVRYVADHVHVVLDEQHR